ncbi:MAG: hypothetical protein ACOZE5_07685 [Verrucomicrobiota bacterium]
MKPYVTAKDLASFLAAKSPERKMSIVRAAWRAIHSERKFAPFYQALKTPAKKFLAGGAQNIEGLLQLIKRASVPKKDRPWHKTDARITPEAARKLIALAPNLRALDVVFVSSRKGTKARLEYPDIDVGVPLDMFVEKRVGGATRVGAVRLYTAKDQEFELGPKAAEFFAAMEYLWLIRTATGSAMPDPALCMVIECFQQRITPAPADVEPLAKAIEQGCRNFARLWHSLDSQDAA